MNFQRITFSTPETNGRIGFIGSVVCAKHNALEEGYRMAAEATGLIFQSKPGVNRLSPIIFKREVEMLLLARIVDCWRII